MKNPKISIITATLNNSVTLRKTLNSLLNLDYDADYELIVINDGSVDSTLTKMQKFISEHNALYFRIMNHSNMGKAASLNKAIEIANGKYFACLDADSFIKDCGLPQNTQ